MRKGWVCVGRGAILRALARVTLSDGPGVGTLVLAWWVIVGVAPLVMEYQWQAD